jgi:S-adenosylmethionine decarboxylase
MGTRVVRLVKVLGSRVEMAIVGVEWLVDAEGCSPGALSDAARVRSLLERIIRELELKVVGEGAFHVFTGPDGMPGGVTALYLLSESHLACHTYPEVGVATINLYCCKSRQDWPWATVLEQTLGSREVKVEKRVRGESP